VIPAGFGRITLIVAVIALIAYLITGKSSLAMVFLAGIVFVALHWAYNGGWGPDSYGPRSAALGTAEPVLGGQAGSPSQWVWYVVGVVGFLVAIAILMSIAQTL
jgi:bacteriorhodopsin